jgi:hypothetical protein
LSKMNKHKLLSYCGLYCGGCRNYIENSGEYKCHGCRVESELVSDCPTKVCAVSKDLLHCGECAVFPCDMLDKFYKDGSKHHALAFDNVLRIKAIGADQWLSEQEKEHACSCGKRRLWFDKDCKHDTK